MARLYTTGFELGDVVAEGLAESYATAVQAASDITGAYCFKYNANDSGQWCRLNLSSVNGRAYYHRVKFRTPGAGPVEFHIYNAIQSNADVAAHISLNTSRQLVLRDNAGTVLYTSSALV